MKKFIFLIILVFSCSICFADEVKFTDIEKHWAKDVIEIMARDGAISGYADNTFQPNQEVTIAEFLKMLVVEQDFKLDVTGERWPDWYINTAIKYNLITKEQFDDYNAPLKRVDACKIISNYIGLDDVKKSTKTFNDLNEQNKDIHLMDFVVGLWRRQDHVSAILAEG